MDEQYEGNINQDVDNLPIDAENAPVAEVELQEPIQDSGEATDFYSEDEEDASEEEVESKTSKKKLHEHISEVQRLRYQALHENAMLRAENERLNALSNASVQTAIVHYEQAANQRLEAAKKLKLEAYDSGDPQQQIQADLALAKAVNEIEVLNQKKYEQSTLQQPNYQQPLQAGYQQPLQPNYQEQQFSYQQPNYNAPQEIARANAESWVSQNPWFQPSSPSYDPWLAQEANNYCVALDNDLYQSGRGNKVMIDPAYFEAINQHVRGLVEQRNRGNRRDLNMSTARTNVSPVRNGGAPTRARQPVNKESSYTHDELIWAKRMGVTPEEYVAARNAEIKDTPWKREGRRR